MMILSIFTVAACIACNVGAENPPQRAHHSMTYDEATKRVVLTGGSTPRDGGSRFEFFNDLWEFDGKAWTQRPSSGEPVSGVALAYDPRRRRLLSFGGYRGNSLG